MKALRVGLIGAASAVTPVEKVIQMLQDIYNQGVDDMKAEEVEAARFKEECVAIISRQKELITRYNGEVEEADAKIAEGVAAIAELDDEVASIEKSLAQNAADMKAASEVRGKEKADFVVMSQDYAASLSALERAIAHLKQVDVGKVAPAETFMQLRNSNRLLAEAPVGAPQAVTTSYESSTGGVQRMLKELKDKFESESHEAAVKERARQDEYLLLKTTMAAGGETGKRDLARKARFLKERSSEKASAEGDKELAESQGKDAKQMEAAKKGECSVNNKLLEEQITVRKQEIEAVHKAIVILSGDNVSGAEKRNLKPLAPSFLQFGNVSPDNLKKALAFIDSRAKTLSSKHLSALSLRIKSDESPFADVLKMIRQMISNLKAQAVADAEKKGSCDAKFAKLNIQKEAGEENVAKLSSRVDSMSAKNVKLVAEIAELTATLENLSRDRGQATTQRAENKAANEKTIKESKEAQEAIAQAYAVLEEFYSGVPGQHAAANAENAKAGKLNTEVYSGQGEQASGVLAILETIAGDFSELEVETTQLEASQAKAYEELMNTGEVEVAKMETVKKMKVEKVADLSTELASTQTELENEKKGLAETNEILAATKVECSAAVPFEQRMKQREAEIQSLKEALEVLRGIGTAGL